MASVKMFTKVDEYIQIVLVRRATKPQHNAIEIRSQFGVSESVPLVRFWVCLWTQGYVSETLIGITVCVLCV